LWQDNGPVTMLSIAHHLVNVTRNWERWEQNECDLSQTYSGLHDIHERSRSIWSTQGNL